eukprot:gene13005-15296_t
MASGDFYSNGFIKLALPAIEVEDFGSLSDQGTDCQGSLPSCTCKEDVDTNVRNVWQVARDSLNIGKEWDDSMVPVLKNVAMDSLDSTNTNYSKETRGINWTSIDQTVVQNTLKPYVAVDTINKCPSLNLNFEHLNTGSYGDENKQELRRAYGGHGPHSFKYCKDVHVRKLSKLSEDLHFVGDFYSYGLEKLVALPEISVKDVGMLTYPIKEQTVKDIIAKHAVQVETNVWQVATDSLTIGKKWDDAMVPLLRKVTVDMGLCLEQISAKLVKMIIYQKDGSFFGHRPEKESRKFGKLVISLPCPHKGGDMVIEHNGNVINISLENDTLQSINYAAFYSSCSHSAKPVKEGYQETGEWMQEAFKNVEIDQLVYVLRTCYSTESLRHDRLKSHDAKVFELFTRVGKHMDYNVYLGVLTIKESGCGPEHSSNYINGAEITISGLEDYNGNQLDGSVNVYGKEIFPAKSLDSINHVSEEISGKIGYDVKFQRTYLHTAILIQPTSS